MDGNYQKTQQTDEIFDEELQGVGIPYEDKTEPKEMSKREGCVVGTGHEKKPCRKEPAKPMDAPHASVQNTEVNLMKRVLGCVKWVLPCGIISMLLWWFQINDLMVMQAAYPCILLSSIIGAAGGAWNAK